MSFSNKVASVAADQITLLLVVSMLAAFLGGVVFGLEVRKAKLAKCEAPTPVTIHQKAEWV